jgi:glycosyltransferase involved in cell wall biosynthesis
MTRRILLVHANAELYGADLVCLFIAQGMAEAGWEVEVIVPRPGPLVERLEAAGAAVTFIDPLVVRRADLRGFRALAFPFAWLANLWRLWRFARTRRFDIVHTNTAPAMAGYPLARWTGARHVVKVQEFFWQRPSLVRLLERRFTRADRVVCISRGIRDQFHNPDLLARCVVIHLGVDVVPSEPPVTPLQSPTVSIVCVGRINVWKGQEVLLDAVAEVRHRLPPLEVRIVGDVYASEHHYRERLEAQVARLGLGDVVRFLGERRDALAIVGRSDVFVMPSRQPEPFGLALVEAMALGRPVIATDAAGPADIVTSGFDGVLVPIADSRALGEALVELVAHPEDARRMGERAAQRAAEFPVSKLVASLRALYEELLGEGAGDA